MTYLIQNNVAHFYNTQDIEVSFPYTITIHTNKHSMFLLKRDDVKKVIDIPFVLNDVFVKSE
jgi:mRNA-degrading endonuclease HigB of HigAB toxin-antitoxin module